MGGVTNDAELERGAHLLPSARALLDLPWRERILQRWDDIWIGHRDAKEIHSRLNDLLFTPRSLRPRNLLIFGESGVGKSTILRRWAKRVNAEAAIRAEQEDPAGLGDWATLPVIMIQTPPRGDESRLYNNLLIEFGFPMPGSYAIAEKERTVRRLVKATGVKAIILDEFHNALSGRFDQRLHFNVVIKNLSNETGVPLVVSGTSGVDQVFRKEDQLHRRFSRIELKRWPQTAAWTTLLTSFERLIPLAQPSRLFAPEMSNRLYTLSDGIIGELSEVLRRAAIKAASSGDERIELEMLERPA